MFKLKIFEGISWRQKLPETLFGRSLLLLIIPLTLVQIVSIFIFFDRHWQSVLRQLADNCATNICATILLIENDPESLPVVRFVKENFDIDVEDVSSISYLPRQEKRKVGTSFQDGILEEALENHLKRPFLLTIDEKSFIVHIKIGAVDKAFLIPRKKIGIKAIRLYFAWSLGMSVFLLIIAAIFLRNQMRPLQRLAEAVHSFGKGRKSNSFRPAGTKEIRKVGAAFIVMRDRLQRYIIQRTHMLAGVSHDLRTPLTRMKLQIALLAPHQGLESISQDIQEMEKLIKGYLDFVSNESMEQSQTISIVPFIRKIIKKISSTEKDRVFLATLSTPLKLTIKPHQLERCLDNILSNALRYGKNKITISLEKRKRIFAMIIDDDGPGIPIHERKNIFKPFYRLEKSRNQETGGTGLGLAIAQDGMRSQGGNIILGDSPLGGLRVQLIFPL